ncbi:hypothetical protein GF359_08305 [candidate division WOR-3 bacterium]|uniref:T9SS type A sorting domain-containing protein n=1 Tax=candidate division WOR-3 bacterium TaxID=2052148 RepID=A0A9D5QCZ7_UNCW3|nr:hypothetical protein [candidate division WOR-3 bacterium]MBD3365203.1 hypothetical protein [candidate division WOR-3 bacterium]
MTVELGDCGDVFLLKTNADGDNLWGKTYGGGLNDQANCVRQTTDRGYIMTGYADGDSVQPFAGSRLLLLKVDSLGDTMWVKKWGGFSTGNWVEQTADGGYIVTGDCDGAYLWLIKIDENGDYEWQRKIDYGGTEVGYCVRQTMDGGYIVAANIGLYRFDENGDSLWLNPQYVKFVTLASDGGYFAFCGRNGDMWFLRFDDKGDTLWTKTYGGDGDEAARCAQQTTDGGFMIVGETESFGAGKTDVWLLRTDSLGDTLWTRTFGGEHHDNASSGQQTSDGGFIIAGHLSMLYPTQGVLLIKTDSTGDAGIGEPVTHPVTQPDWQVVSTVGSTVNLSYVNHPQGFHAAVFDAAGRKVDEIASTSQSGTITWGEGQMPGVYFIREQSSGPCDTRKVILIP